MGTLFSIPIEHQIATDVFRYFRDHQRSQPIVNIAAFLSLPRWVPRLFSRRAWDTAIAIPALIRGLTEARMAEIEKGEAPNNRVTKNHDHQRPAGRGPL